MGWRHGGELIGASGREVVPPRQANGEEERGADRDHCNDDADPASKTDCTADCAYVSVIGETGVKSMASGGRGVLSTR